MADILDNAAHLAQTIGPRPAGTEEERQAALYLSEALQRKAGLPTEVEDFTCPTDFELPRAIYCLVAVVLTALTFFIPVLVIVAFIVVLIMAALYAVETLVRPLLAPMMSHGASQNVVAKYEPADRSDARGARQRKVVLLAHYDTGKVRAELKPALAPLLPIVYWVELGGMVLLALLLLLRLVSTPTGGFAVVVTVLTVLACIAALLPVAAVVLHRTAPYTDGANCNAAGVAVMVEVATRLRKGRARADEAHALEVRVHGEEAARSNGLVPDGASLTYEAEATEEASGSAEDRLMAAKAAVAMLTGKPVSATVNIDLDEAAEQPMLVQDAEALVAEEELLQADAALVSEAAEAVAAQPEATFDPRDNTVDEQPVTFTLGGPAPAPVPAEVSAAPTMTFEATAPEPASDVPDWFKAARAKARKSPGGQMPVTRSRYAEAEATAREAISARNAALEAQAAAEAEHQAMTETEMRLAQVRESIMEQHPVRSAAAPAGEGASEREEVSTVAFAPVEINGDELRREAQKQKDAEAVEAKTAEPAPQPAEEAPAQAPEPQPAPIPEAPAPQVDAKAAARIDNLRKSIPLVGDAAATEAPAAAKKAASEAAPATPRQREATSEEQKARQDALRQVLPSLSGSIKVSPDLFAKADKADADPADISSEKTDAFAPVGATKAFSPVTEATAELLTEEEIVEDADDSSYDGQLTETGAYTGREYVEMPEGRASRFFGKFRRNKKAKRHEAAEPSAAEWLDVDEDYDARERGEQLGEWSTRNRYVDDPDDGFDDYDDLDAFDDDDDAFADSGFKPRGWNGGVFSRESLDKVRGMVKRDAKDDAAGEPADAVDPADAGDAGEAAGTTRRRRRKAAGVDALFADTSAAAAALSADASAEPVAAGQPHPEPAARSTAAMSALDDVQAVHDFRLPNIGIEVWFVALGADLAANSGMKDFLAAHRDELKGAIFIDLDALGAGDLTCINSEGMYFPAKPSSRMSRYARKAASALGIHVGEGSMLWRDSAAAVALRQGCQAMHFAGMEGDLPAYAASKQDTMDHISEDTMLANADFVVEVLKNI